MPIVSTVVLVALVLSAGWFDARLRKIPNWLNASGLAIGIVLGACHGMAGLRTAALGCVCALAVYLPLYILRGMGAGDVKLMAAVGALTGPSNWLVVFFVTAILGGLASLGLVVVRRACKQTLNNLLFIISEVLQFRAPCGRAPELDIRNPRALRLPHGVVIAAGCLIFTVYVRSH
jgi:prepilin peptidase CpaA